MRHYTYRAAPIAAFTIALLVVVPTFFAVRVRADDGNVVTPSGDNGANAGQVIATSTDGTGGLHDVGGTVTTGDAVATTTAQNNVNLNDVGDVDSPGNTNSSSITATSSNEAAVDTFSTSTASTGANSAQGGQGLATVVTGNAFAFANVINLINTNIFNSQGLLVFLNQIFSTGLDLRDFNLDYFFDGQAGASPTVDDAGKPQCTLLTCLNSSSLNVLSGNTATVTNSVIVRADAGGNTATTTDDGGADITTGSAYASANVINLVNTNIINSSYLMVSFNNFGDLDGNITLPGDDFFAKLFAHGGSAPAMNSSSYGINNTNSVNLTGTTTAGATTGGNVATTTGEGNGIVSTGNAYSTSNAYTDANSNYFGGTSAFFLFRVAGEWTGAIKGLPASLTSLRMFDVAEKDGAFSTSTLVLVTSEDASTTPPEAAGANCDSPNDHRDNPQGLPINNCFNSSSFLASSTNSALVDNNIDVGANTGSNLAMTQDGTAHIITGDAYAIANVVNMVNTNVVGRNWIFALFNVLGNWRGDITFGKSALQLEASTAQAPVAPGSIVDYTFTIANNGDRDADDIVLKADFDKSLLGFADSDGVQTDTGREWHLPTVRRGGSQTFTYRAHVGSIPSGTSMTVPVAVSVLSDGINAQAQASFTLATLNVVSAPSGGTSSAGRVVNTPAALVPDRSSKDPNITITKQITHVSTTTPSIVDYKVVVTNDKKAGPLYAGKLNDTLYDPTGAVMYQRSWDLDAVAAGDQLLLTYSVQFPTTTIPGTYRNVAEVTGMRYSATQGAGQPAAPVQGVGTVIFTPGGAVLGAATDCSLAVAQNLSRGMSNPEVVKLQTFLNAQIGSMLPVTGFFGPMTQAAVSAFQSKYAADILAPLGLTRPTGSVASMTRNKIRALACIDTAATTAVPTTDMTTATTTATTTDSH